MLCFRVDYLSGRVYAARDKQNLRLEFPPDPARLYSALVAAAYENGGVDEGEKITGEVREALTWLEGQDPPCIVAAELSITEDGRIGRNGGTSYVPPNPQQKATKRDGITFTMDHLPEFRNFKRQPRKFQSAALSDPTVYFIYQNAEANEHRSVLETLASRVARLGTAASFVSVTLCDSPPAPTLVPDEYGNVLLRTHTRNRLGELEAHYRHHDTQRGAPEARKVYYRRADEVTEAGAPRRGVFDKMIVLRLKGRRAYIEDSVRFTDALRKALISIAGENVPPVLHGHDRNPHCAFVALPHVGHERAQGEIKGLAVLMPNDVEREEYRAVLRSTGEIEHLQLSFGSWLVERIESDDDALWTLRERTWTRPSRVWESVTPVMFDRHPRERTAGRSVKDIVAASCAYVRLPPPSDVKSNLYSHLGGVPPANQFKKRRREEDSHHTHGFVSHVTIEFAEDIEGPVVLGAGRYFGLGSMRPAKTKGAER